MGRPPRTWRPMALWTVGIGAAIILAVSACWLYRRERTIVESVSPDGRWRAVVTARRSGWTPEGFDVRLCVRREAETALDRVIDNVDLSVDAEQAYGVPVWADSGLEFRPGREAVDAPARVISVVLTP